MARAPKKPESGSGADFVSSIVTDPKSVPDVMRLYGYLGASSEEGHERLYLNPDLTNYVEVPTQAILHRMTVPAEQDPYSAVCLWVKKDAALIYKMTPAAQALAHYFAGAIQAGTPGAAVAAVAGAAPQTVFCPTPPVTVPCQWPSLIWCQTPACTIAGPGCRRSLAPRPVLRTTQPARPSVNADRKLCRDYAEPRYANSRRLLTRKLRLLVRSLVSPAAPAGRLASICGCLRGTRHSVATPHITHVGVCDIWMVHIAVSGRRRSQLTAQEDGGQGRMNRASDTYIEMLALAIRDQDAA